MGHGIFKPEETLCLLCLRRFVPESYHQAESGLCPSCRAKADRRRQQAQKPKRKPKTGLTIEQVCAMAKAAGMTYGKYVAKMEL